MAGEALVRIGGVDVTHWLADHPSIDYAINRRGMARLSFTDRAAGFLVPALFADCTIAIDGTVMFGGSILTIRGRELRQIGAAPYAAGTRIGVDVSDYASIADRCVYNGITPAGTLRDAVAPLVGVMSAHGVTLGAGPAGPTVPALGVPFALAREPLDQLCQLAGYVWSIDPTKVLYLRPGGYTAAPRELTIPSARVVSVEWEQTQRLYRSRQWVQFGEPGVRPFTMNATSDGVRTVYPLIGVGRVGEIRPTVPIPTVTVGGVVKPVSYVGDAAHDWWYRQEPAAVQLELRPGAAIPPNGTAISATFEAQFPGAVFRSVAGPLADAIDTITTTDDPAAAVQYADALLAQYGITPKTITCETRWLDFRPGQAVAVTLPAWTLSGSYLIESVQIRHVLQQRPQPGMLGQASHAWIARLGLVQGDASRGSWLDFWRTALTVGTGSGVSFSGAGTGGGGGGTTVTGAGLIYAGGSRALAVLGTGAYLPIAEFVDVLIEPGGVSVYTLRCHAWLARAGGTITVRVLALEAVNIVVGTGPARSPLDWADPNAFVEFDFTLRLTAQYYRVEANVSTAGNEGFVAGCVCYPKATARAA